VSSILNPHHPRCVGAIQRHEGPDEGETVSAFTARARGFRCTCRDQLALGLAPLVQPFLRQPCTDELRALIESVVSRYVLEVNDREHMAVEHEIRWSDPPGAFLVRWYPQGKAEYERALAEYNRHMADVAAIARREGVPWPRT